MMGLMHKLGALPPQSIAVGLLVLALAFAFAEGRHRSVANILLMFAAGGVGFMFARVWA